MLTLLLVALTLAGEPTVAPVPEEDAALPVDIPTGDPRGDGGDHIDRGRTIALLLTEDGLLQLTPSGVAILRDPATLAVLADVVAPTPIVGLAPDPENGSLLLDRAGDLWRWTRAGGVTVSGLPSLAGLPLWNGLLEGRRIFVVSTPAGVDIVDLDRNRVPMWLTPDVIVRRAYSGPEGMWFRPARPEVGRRYVDARVRVYGVWKGRLYFQGDENHYWCHPRKGILHVIWGGHGFPMLGRKDRLFADQGLASTPTTAPEMWGWYGPFGDVTYSAIGKERVDGAWLDGDRLVLTTESGALWTVDRSLTHWRSLAAANPTANPTASSDRPIAVKVPDGLVVATHGRLWRVGSTDALSTLEPRASEE